VPEFTLRQLQHPLGVSYHHTYRVFHGYTSRGKIYSGLLEKCPAISFVDATITSESTTGTVRKHEHVFTFDREIYRRWNGAFDVWLEPDIDGGDDSGDSGSDNDDNSADHHTSDSASDVCSIAADLQQVCSRCCKDENAQSGSNNADLTENRETFILTNSTLQQNVPPQNTDVPHMCTASGVCAQRSAANNIGTDEILEGKGNQEHIPGGSTCSTFRNVLQPAATAATAAKKGVHCSYDTHHSPGVIPLPGILDHTTFRRSPVCLGTCAICGEGAAVYQSKEQRTSICETCYARLVREWNVSEGVV